MENSSNFLSNTFNKKMDEDDSNVSPIIRTNNQMYDNEGGDQDQAEVDVAPNQNEMPPSPSNGTQQQSMGELPADYLEKIQ